MYSGKVRSDMRGYAYVRVDIRTSACVHVLSEAKSMAQKKQMYQKCLQVQQKPLVVTSSVLKMAGILREFNY